MLLAVYGRGVGGHTSHVKNLTRLSVDLPPLTSLYSSSAELYLAIPHTPTVQQNKQSLELMGGALGPGAKVRDKSHDQYKTHMVVM